MTIIEKHYYINSPANKVWAALTDPKIIENWGAGPAIMNSEEGTNFSLWGGDIWGTNLEIEENKKLVQDWYGGKWEKPSRVVFTLNDQGSKTQLSLLHTEMPKEETKELDKGWDDFYLGAIKQYLES
ncbi:ATPase [bacterium]|nr:ATPase [bacterium]